MPHTRTHGREGTQTVVCERANSIQWGIVWLHPAPRVSGLSAHNKARTQHSTAQHKHSTLALHRQRHWQRFFFSGIRAHGMCPHHRLVYSLHWLARTHARPTVGAVAARVVQTLPTHVPWAKPAHTTAIQAQDWQTSLDIYASTQP